MLLLVLQLLAVGSAACLQVLRQQALDYSTWKHDQDEKYAAHYKAMYVSTAAAIALQRPVHSTTRVPGCRTQRWSTDRCETGSNSSRVHMLLCVDCMRRLAIRRCLLLLQGEGLDPKKRKPDLLTGMLKRVQGMLQVSPAAQHATNTGRKQLTPS